MLFSLSRYVHYGFFMTKINYLILYETTIENIYKLRQLTIHLLSARCAGHSARR